MKYETVEKAKNYLLEKFGATPDIAVIMGAGVSAVDEILSHSIRIHYTTIPNFPVPKVAGHQGQVVFGTAHGLKVIPGSVAIRTFRPLYAILPSPTA